MFFYRGIYISGHSAGGHLAVELFEKCIPNLPQTTRNLIKGAFLISGIYDLVPLIQTDFNITLKLDESTAAAASPLRQNIIGGDTDFYVIIPQNDCPAFVQQAEAMVQHLSKLGSKAEYISLENHDHFDIIENLFDTEFQLTKFILEKIKKSL